MNDLIHIAQMMEGWAQVHGPAPAHKLQEWADRIAHHAEELRAVLGAQAECPCCQERQACSAGCTFADDAPRDADAVAFLREFL